MPGLKTMSFLLGMLLLLSAVILGQSSRDFIKEPQNTTCILNHTATFSCVPTSTEVLFWEIDGTPENKICVTGNCSKCCDNFENKIYTLTIWCGEEFDHAEIVCAAENGSGYYIRSPKVFLNIIKTNGKINHYDPTLVIFMGINFAWLNIFK